MQRRVDALTTAQSARGQTSEVLAGAARAPEEAPLPQAPALRFTPDTLSETLGRLEAAYVSGVEALNQRGILQGGELPFSDGMAVTVDGARFTKFRAAPFGHLADRIRADEALQSTFAHLERGPDGLILVGPDLRAGSLKRQVDVARPQMAVYATFDLGGDATGNLIPFDVNAVTMEEDEEREKFVKKILLESGAFGSKGLLGVSLMDSGLKVPAFTLRMNMFDAMAHCIERGLRPVSPETYHGTQAISDEKLDAWNWIWLDGFDRSNNRALFGGWTIHNSGLVLARDSAGTGSPYHGVRCEARVLF